DADLIARLERPLQGADDLHLSRIPRPFDRLAWLGFEHFHNNNVGGRIRNRLEARIGFAARNGAGEEERDEQTECDGERFHDWSPGKPMRINESLQSLSLVPGIMTWHAVSSQCAPSSRRREVALGEQPGHQLSEC